MRYEIWQSVNYRDCAFEYVPGSPMKKVWEGVIELHASDEGHSDDPQITLDMLFHKFQRVDDTPGAGYHMPPVGYEGRSLSVGDVVMLEGHGFYACCAPVGWEMVGPIEVADARALIS